MPSVRRKQRKLTAAEWTFSASGAQIARYKSSRWSSRRRWLVVRRLKRADRRANCSVTRQLIPAAPHFLSLFLSFSLVQRDKSGHYCRLISVRYPPRGDQRQKRKQQFDLALGARRKGKVFTCCVRSTASCLRARIWRQEYKLQLRHSTRKPPFKTTPHSVGAHSNVGAQLRPPSFGHFVNCCAHTHTHTG